MLRYVTLFCSGMSPGVGIFLNVTGEAEKKQGRLWESLWTGLKTLSNGKLTHIMTDPTHPLRHDFDSRHSNGSGRFLLPKTINTNR